MVHWLKRSPWPAWIVYGALVAVALAFTWDGDLDIGVAQGVFLAAWLGFLAYSIHCSRHENFMRSLKAIIQYRWGRQIGTDLYLGLALAMAIMYYHGGAVAVAVWLVPTLIFANLSILLYFGLHLDDFAGLGA